MKALNLLYILLLSFWMFSCESRITMTEDTPLCHKVNEPINPIGEDWQPGEMSLYNLSSDWVNQNSDSLQLEQLQGKLQLVALMYTSCSYACPRILHDIKMIDEKLTEEEKKFVNIVLVTLDPNRDTPEILKSFADKNRLDMSRWQLLTSSESNIRELSGLLNVKYKKEATLEISHSNIISLLDANGELIHQKEGLGIDPDETVNEIKKEIFKRILI